MALSPKYKGVIKTAIVTAGGLGAPGLFNPVLDVAGVTGIWTTMVGAIAVKSGHSFDSRTVAKLAGAAATGVSGYMLGSKILTWMAAPLILAFPFAGVPAALALNVMLNGLFTYRLGVTVAKQFEKPDFTTDDVIDLSLNIAKRLLFLPSADEISEVRTLFSA